MATPARLLSLACLFLSLIAWVHDDESHGILFKHSVTKEKEPWTNKTFLNEPNGRGQARRLPPGGEETQRTPNRVRYQRGHAHQGRSKAYQ